MTNAIFSFVAMSRTSTVASVRIARFISKELDIPVYDDETIAIHQWDILIIVNGAFAFCKCLPALANAIRRAKRVIWVQNDYSIIPPLPVTGAHSPFRRAVQQRIELGRAPMDYWTTVKPVDGKTLYRGRDSNIDLTADSAYINWNALTALKTPLECAPGHKDLYYYGAFRAGRLKAFDRYFLKPRTNVTISSTSKKFAARYADIFHDPGISDRGEFYTTLNAHGLGLYIEDVKSHTEFHSPANRFYEMLSAGLPMVFEPESQRMLRAAGFDVKEYIAKDERAVKRHMAWREDIAAAQRADWWMPFKQDLRKKLKSQYRTYLSSLQD